MKCPDCAGAGEIREAGVTCALCGGSGVVEPDERDREIERLREVIRLMLRQCPAHARIPCPGCIAEAALDAAGRKS